MVSNQFAGSDLPEVYDGHNLPQVYDRENLPEVCGPNYEDGLHAVDRTKIEPAKLEPENPEPSDKVPFWTKKKICIVAGVAAFVVIAVVVGVTVGVVVGGRGTNRMLIDMDGSDKSKTEQSDMALTATTTAFATPSASATVCHSSICPGVLAAAQPSSDPKAFFIFGRGADKAIWYRESDGSKWLNDWASLGGEFMSQPAAVSIREGRIDLFGIDSRKKMRTKTYQNSTWNSTWSDLGGDCYAAPAVCSMRSGRMDLFTLSSSHQLAHKYFENEQWDSLKSGGGWNRWTGYIASSLAATCRGNNLMDVTGYGNQKAPFKVASKNWNGSDFEEWTTLSGNFQSDPSTIAMGGRTEPTFWAWTGTRPWFIYNGVMARI